jgi:integrase
MGRPGKVWWRASVGAWYATIHGRKVNLGTDHAEATRRFHRLKAAGEVAPPGAIAAADLFGRFLDAAKASTAPRTYEYYRDRLKPFGQSLGRRKAEDLKPLHVTQWMDAHPTWGQATRRAVVVAARRACCWGVEQGLIDVDPLARLKRPRMPRRRGITAEDAARIAAAIASPAVRDLFDGLLWTGMRPGELATLRAADISPDNRSAEVVGKSGRRVVRLAAAHPDGPIFRNARGRPWNRNAMRCAFRRLRARAGVEGVTPYALRHLFATLAIGRGVDSADVAKLMGHAGTEMLMEHYYQPADDALRRAAEKAAGE